MSNKVINCKHDSVLGIDVIIELNSSGDIIYKRGDDLQPWAGNIGDLEDKPSSSLDELTLTGKDGNELSGTVQVLSPQDFSDASRSASNTDKVFGLDASNNCLAFTTPQDTQFIPATAFADPSNPLEAEYNQWYTDNGPFTQENTS